MSLQNRPRTYELVDTDVLPSMARLRDDYERAPTESVLRPGALEAALLLDELEDEETEQVPRAPVAPPVVAAPVPVVAAPAPARAPLVNTPDPAPIATLAPIPRVERPVAPRPRPARRPVSSALVPLAVAALSGLLLTSLLVVGALTALL